MQSVGFSQLRSKIVTEVVRDGKGESILPPSNTDTGLYFLINDVLGGSRGGSRA